MPNLTLLTGNNSITASGNFQPNNNEQGQETLNDFVGKKDVGIVIQGYENSTKIASLVQAFNTLSIGATLPGLTTDLLSTTALKVLTTTGHSDNVSHVTVDLVIPFTADLKITEISSTVTSHGINLGTINQTLDDFTASGKKTTTSPRLPQ